jgi:hypothetical protein
MYKKIGVKVTAFADYNPNLTGKSFCGLPIYYTPTISKHFPNALYVISVMTIKDVRECLYNQGIRGMVAGGYFLEGIDTTQDSPDYLIDDEKYQIESCRIAHNAFLTGSVFLRSIDIMITEKCSLKCKDCSNLMQYFQHPKNYNVQDILYDIFHITGNTDEILELRILGGDTFKHPEWARIVDYAARFDNVRRVVVYTNGMIAPKDISALSHPKVIVAVTDYGKLSRNVNKLIDRFRENGVWHRVSKVTEWVDCGTIKMHNRTDAENDKLFQECVATNLATLVDSKVFRCPFAASAYQLGVIDDNPDDYLDLSTASREALDGYINSKGAMSACDYCTSRILSNKIQPAIQTKEVLKW